ncbi:MAG: cytochrome c [Deltaproteobacteria bacterium]|nr:cytochrome c [Deltaproteobacteria bacterium]
MALAACDRHKTAYEYMPDMADAVSVKAYEGDAASPGNRSVRPPVKGTIPRGFTPYPYPESPEAAASLRNPLPRTTAILRQGQKTFQTHCQVCHGGRGLGDGPIVPKFPKPPSLVSEKVGAWTDGRIFHVITRGQNLMPSYAAQVSPEERWAAIHYVRVLQRAAHPTPEDIRRVAGKKGTDGQP